MRSDNRTATAQSPASDAVPAQDRRSADSYVAGSLLLSDFQPQYAAAPVRACIRYCLYGDAAAPLVVVLGGISATRHVLDSPDGAQRGWWPTQVGPGRGVDLDRYRVLSFDYFTGLDCEAGRCARVSTADQAQILAALLDALHIRQVHALVGASYGAMVGLAFAALHPARLARLIAISGAERPHPMATAFRSLQRQIVRLGLKHNDPVESLALARALGLITYSTHREFEQRFAAAPAATGDEHLRFPVEDHLAENARTYAAQVAPEAFLRLSESLDTHSVDARRIRVPTTLVAAHPDLLVPLEQMRALAKQLGSHARLIEIVSPYGHDAFLHEQHRFTALLDTALTSGVSP